MTTPRALLDFLGFQLVWLACALGAANGDWRPGVIGAAALVAGHVIASTDRRAAVVGVLAAGFIGIIGETALIQTRLVSYPAGWAWAAVSPPWLIALWAAFGTTSRASRHVLGPAPLIKAAAVAAISAPLAYAGGASLGALAVTPPQWQGYLAIAALWAIAYPAVLGAHLAVMQRQS
jgi:hypothetical protein